MLSLITALCTTMVCVATVPVLAGLYQYLLVAFSFVSTQLERATRCLPRVSILIPAWNEAAVIASTLTTVSVFFPIVFVEASRVRSSVIRPWPSCCPSSPPFWWPSI